MSVASKAMRERGNILSPEHSIMLVFFLQAFAGGGLFPRIPDIQSSLELNEGALGLALMGQPVGAFLSILFASWFIERFGPKTILSLTIPMIALATLLIGFAPGRASLFAAMFAYGISFAFANVSMNVEADRVEAATGSRVMNRCHGLWSLGFLVSSTLGAGARGIPLDVTVHFGLVAPVVVLCAALFVWPIPASRPRAHDGPVRKKRLFAVPSLATLVLVGIILSGVMADAATRAWSVIYMRDMFEMPDWFDALTLPAFLFTLTVGRMLADNFVARFGPVLLTRVLLLVALAGLGLVLVGASAHLAILGFALIGLGTCVVFPLTMSAAARIGDRPASENVTSVALMTNVTLLGTPALIGAIAEQFGIRNAFGLLVPVIVLALALSARLATNDSQQRTPSEP